MKTLNYLIVEIEEAYNNTITTENNITLVTNTSIQNVNNITRQAKVIAAPEYTRLRKGDEVIVHHNIFRLRNGIKGKLINSNFLIEKNRYFVPLTEVFMYKRNISSDWKALDPYCFVKPLEYTGNRKIKGFFMSNNHLRKTIHKGNEKLKGIVTYTNKALIKRGINDGDDIIFSPDSEYEFSINGEIHYRMKTTDIIIKYERTI